MIRRLLFAVVAVVIAGSAYGLDLSDLRPEWTDEGKRLAKERAMMPVKNEMVTIPAGWFLMGSDRKADRMARRPELPEHRVYLDAYEIDKYEVSALQFLRFVLATDGQP